MQNLNETILIYLNSLLENKFIEKITIFLADIPIFFLPIFLLSSWFFYTFLKETPPSIPPLNKGRTGGVLEEKKNNLLFMFYSVILAILINLIIQHFFHFSRPEKVLEWVWKLLLNHIPDASFPSDHASVSFAFLTALFLANYKKIWYIFAIFVIWMNFSRVILWVHWPFDIIVWALIWVLSAFITFNFFKKSKFFTSLNKFIIFKIMKKIWL